MLTNTISYLRSSFSPTKNLVDPASDRTNTMQGIGSIGLATVVFCWFVCAVGCTGNQGSSPTAAVSGRVLLDGQPLQSGVIRFVPAGATEGRKTVVQLKDGEFSLPRSQGPVIGKHRVEIESRDNGGYELDDEFAIEQLRKRRVRRLQVAKIPSRYNSQSRLAVEVSAQGQNAYVFKLTSE